MNEAEASASVHHPASIRYAVRDRHLGGGPTLATTGANSHPEYSAALHARSAFVGLVENSVAAGQRVARRLLRNAHAPIRKRLADRCRSGHILGLTVQRCSISCQTPSLQAAHFKEWLRFLGFIPFRLSEGVCPDYGRCSGHEDRIPK
jgi:hypothetical protein